MENDKPIVERNAKGRQKVEITKITDDRKLAVTFSKRRIGLFRKAGELATLCGAEVAIMVASPGGRVYKFGSPSADAVVERYLHGFHHAPPLQTFAASTSRARSDAVAGGLHAQLQRVEEESRAEKRKASELRRRRKDLEEKCWMAAPIHTMCRPQLMDMKARLLHMSEELTRQISIMGVHNASDNADDAGSSSGAAQLAADQMISPPQMTAPPELDENMAWETNMMMMMSLGDDGCDNLGGPYGRGDGVN